MLQTDFSRVRGFNYQPGYGSTSYENWMWFDGDAVRRELGWGKKAFPGINTIRLWLSWDAYVRNPQAFTQHFEEALQICESYGLRVIACLFNRWHNAFCDNGGVYLEKLIPGSQQYDRWFFRPYLEDVCAAHRSDPRILVWDLCNEPFSHDMPFSQARATVDCEVSWLKDMFACLREIGVEQHIGTSIHGAVNREMMEAVDCVSTVFMIHPYLQWTPDARAFAERCRKVIDHLDWQVGYAAARSKPVFVTECCWGSIDSRRFAENIRATLTEYRKRNLGFVAHALCCSGVADLHPPRLGPILQDLGQFNFLDENGNIRPGLEVFNEFCEGQVDERC